MVELYTMQRYLDPAGLAERGLDHFDGWAATFGEVVDALEISPDGASLRPRSRFAKFVNLPELQQLFRGVADVRTAEELDLPRPTLVGGKARIVAVPMSPHQEALQRELIERYDRIRSGRIDPREDNALAITTDGRKLALDGRLLAVDADASSGAKTAALVANVIDLHHRSTPVRGTQLIFCDLGVGRTDWGFSVYEAIVAGLIAGGVPAGEIALAGDADTDAKKQALFDKVRAGTVRVLIGSTAKMGAGTNVQKRLVGLHHLDAPWKPAEVELREGRILRQGNGNAEVEVVRYVTEGSFDAYLWQALETKARFIGQVMTGRAGVRRADDVGGRELSYAEVKAIASGNPAVLTLAEADAELQRLAMLRKSHADEEFLARRAVRDLPAAVERGITRLDALRTDRQTLDDHADESTSIGGRMPAADRLLAVLGEVLESLPPSRGSVAQAVPLGRYRGLSFGMERHPNGAVDVTLTGVVRRATMLAKGARGPRAVLNALARLTASLPEECTQLQSEIVAMRQRYLDYRNTLGRPFPHADCCDALQSLRDQLQTALTSPAAEEGMNCGEIAMRIRELLEAPMRSETVSKESPEIAIVRD